MFGIYCVRWEDADRLLGGAPNSSPNVTLCKLEQYSVSGMALIVSFTKCLLQK